MNIKSDSLFSDALKMQGASALLASTFSFLRINKIPKQLILECISQIYDEKKPNANVRQYRKLARAYEEMGIVMSTWFSLPKFLDKEFLPLPLSTGRGSRSIRNLLLASRVSISAATTIELMRRSPSIKVDGFGKLVALRREFVLPGFTVPRAAIVMERYLDTLGRNSSPSKKKAVLLLERNCHVPAVNLRTIAPVLRDIKSRGSAYIDAINGDIEGIRTRNSRRKGVGEMSVHIFAWTRPSRTRKPKGRS